MSDAVLLHGYFRSTASYRVRVALNVKGISYANAFHHLRRNEHRTPTYLSLNPQGLLPALEVGGTVLTQSLAICEYLDETHPTPPLLPSDPLARAKVRAFALAIACDIHPVQNLKILQRLRNLGVSEQQVEQWAATAIDEGLDACDTLLAEQHGRGPYCFGTDVTLADICLIPQLTNAKRFGVTMRWSRLVEIENACLELKSFADARPDLQPDAE